MGIFQSRPEDPTEWAGLPAEPWQPRTPGEVLPPAAPVDVLAFLDGGVGISVEVMPPTAETTDDAAASGGQTSDGQAPGGA